jgi:hypothetical protein
MLRLPAVRPAALRCLRLAVPAECLFSLHAAPGTRAAGLGPVNSGGPFRIVWTGNDGLSHVPGEPHCAHALLLDPGGIEHARPIAAARRGLPYKCGRRRLPRLALFRGSITRPMHSLSTLRSAGHPSTTQDSLPAVGQLCRAGLATCRVPVKGFMRLVYAPTSQSSFPRLFVAHVG